MDMTGLKALAPLDIRSRRSIRFDGKGFELTKEDLGERDLLIVQKLYEALQTFLQRFCGETFSEEELKSFLDGISEDTFYKEITSLGLETYDQKTITPMMRQAFHDLRGGALTAFLGYASLLSSVPPKQSTIAEIIRKMETIAKDHTKMMRSILPFLDPVQWEYDEEERLHPVEGFVTKWQNLSVRIGEQEIGVRVKLNASGFLTSRCLETSAVDRILYNYINNAARFSAEDEIELAVFFANPESLRFVVRNEITTTQKEWLRENIPLDKNERLSPLFEGGYTRGGNGVGLSGCAAIVSDSFGVIVKNALAEGVLGACVDEDSFYAWFHWPACRKEDVEEVCVC
ncbi:MAG TPA: hypothetical protein DCE42_13385 [Myxococcales bacterium]|nr:hypothetical protein [Deltaproteobacteria bacterium]MBU52396.1 hypothetical protein [Deltaproteobacteria bacterium]HAA55750.1 hypothetical protein [Myxococcales bacterium]|tara:strand:+ start:12681 stop:13712 length:1032 start_codon:yes stop_codon:yes gene_type:complete